MMYIQCTDICQQVTCQPLHTLCIWGHGFGTWTCAGTVLPCGAEVTLAAKCSTYCWLSCVILPTTYLLSMA